MIMYAFCHSCGYEAPLLEKGPGKFVLFCEHGEVTSLAHVEIHHDFDIEFECPKCASTHTAINSWPVRK